jgi:hypothetical protein
MKIRRSTYIVQGAFFLAEKTLKIARRQDFFYPSLSITITFVVPSSQKLEMTGYLVNHSLGS